jgi:hypothetical protein
MHNILMSIHFIVIISNILEYGADPYAVNQHGQTPFQLLPADAVRSIKINFQNLFNVRL